jgi:hypothetical protein
MRGNDALLYQKIRKAFTLLVCLFVFPALSNAQAADSQAQLSAAKAHFAREKEADTWWYYGWMTFSGSVFAASTTLYFTAEKDSQLRKAQPVSMAVSGMGVLSLVLLQPRSFAAHEELRLMPENTPDEKKAKLLKSEEWLKKAADRQRFTTGLTAQIGTVLVVGTASVVDAIYYNGPWFGLLRFVATLAVAELKIFTQPTYSRDLWEKRKPGDPLDWHVRMAPGEIALVTFF